MMRVDVQSAEPGDPTERVLALIEAAHRDLASFWTDPTGWAPSEVASVFARCRLDRQAQLARCLRLWVAEGGPDDNEGRLILARANLGALVEGAMQLGLTVFHQDYSASDDAPRKKGELVEAPDAMMEQLRVFFRDVFWLPAESQQWDSWVLNVQRRRNAVHSFTDRDLGTHAEFLADVRVYLAFLAAINERLPYPD